MPSPFETHIFPQFSSWCIIFPVGSFNPFETYTPTENCRYFPRPTRSAPSPVFFVELYSVQVVVFLTPSETHLFIKPLKKALYYRGYKLYIYTSMYNDHKEHPPCRLLKEPYLSHRSKELRWQVFKRYQTSYDVLHLPEAMVSGPISCGKICSSKGLLTLPPKCHQPLRPFLRGY